MPLCTEDGGLLFLNPGSVSIPKENSPHGYMTLAEGLFRWKDFEGKSWQEYKLDLR